MQLRYNSFGSYVRRTFGATLHKVNIDAGFTCPNRDGTLGHSGCVYCNNESFKPGACRPALTVTEQVRAGIEHTKRRYGASLYLAYFQAYTNTYAPVETLERLYAEALSLEGVMGLAIGTRPDCIDEDKLALLERLARKHFILVEYGVQSVHDKTLLEINRGHDYATFLQALSMTHGRGIKIGAHLIAGFPSESRAEMLQCATEVSLAGVDMVKLHQLQVIKNTPLAERYLKSPFQVFSYDEYVLFAADFLERLSPSIVVQRLFAAAPDDILIAPRWERTKHELLNDINRELMRRGTEQGARYEANIALRR